MTTPSPGGEVLTGPSLPVLRRVAFSRANTCSGQHPGSILYLTSDTTDDDRIRDAWTAHGEPLELQVRTLDDIVDHAYDHAFIASQATHFTRSNHRQVIDAGLHHLPRNHRLAPRTPPMSNGHLQQLEDLLTLTEFAGLLTPVDIRRRLKAEGLQNLGGILADLKEAFEAARTTLADGVPRSLRAERYKEVATKTDPTEIYPEVNAVIFGEFDRFSPVEADIIAWIADQVPTYAILPRFTGSETTPTGIDGTLEQVWRTYTNRLGLTPTAVRSDEDTPTAVDPSVFGQFYRPADDPDADRGVMPNVDVIAPMDVGHEARYITRQVQTLLDEDDVWPEDIGIVVTDTSTYLEQIQQSAADRELPVRMTREYDLDATRPGRALFDLLDLLETPTDREILADLLQNPVVILQGYDTDIDARSLATKLDERDRGDVDGSGWDDSASRVLARIEEAARTVADADTIDALPEFAASFGLSESMLETSTHLTREAWQVIDHTIETVEARPELAPRVDWQPALRRALGSAAVTLTTGPESRSVDVRAITDMSETTYDHVFVAGLTDSHYPSRGRRLAFPRRLNEAHPDFDRSRPARRADHRFATLLTAAETATLTRPRLQLDSTEYIAAGVLTELLNHTAIEVTAIDEYSHLVDGTTQQESIGATTDTWRALGVIGGAGRTILDQALDSCQSVLRTYNDETGNTQHETACAGVETAMCRATATPGPRNGWIDAEVARSLARADREPISPSELETYAACGFKHYQQYLLGMEDADEDRTAADRGSLVHDILDDFYTSLGATPGDHVDIAELDPGVLESRLLESALAVLPDPANAPWGLTQWRRELLAGLGDPDRNPQYNPWDLQEPVDGTLARFLEEERTLRGLTEDAGDPVTTIPTHFERHLTGNIGGIQTHGTVDRVDTGEGEFIVRDYKTGSVPSEDDLLDGLAFQLTVYLHLAGQADASSEPLGGTYYAVGGPNDVSSYRRVLAANEDATWHAHGGGPVRRYSTPRLETRAQLDEFMTEAVPDRITTIRDSIADGQHHPTINDPDDAGCSYCAYSDICDVREHNRHDLMDAIDDQGDAYIPLAARDETYTPTENQMDGSDD